MTARSSAPRVAALALVLALAACGSKPARIEAEPSSLRFGVRGHSLKVHASPIASNGKPVPDKVCTWSSSDEKVATVVGPHNEALVTAVGPGNATVACTIGEVRADIPVQVRVVARVVAGPPRVELKVLDEAVPVGLQVQAFDDAGAPVQGRVALSICASEDVCRGDGRAQLWAVAAGDTTAVVEVEGARSEQIAVHVVDARTAAGRPQAVRGNPMEAIERAVLKRDAEERRAAEKAREAGR
jgi:hypothetical protein